MSEEGREGGREKKGTVIEKQERGGREGGRERIVEEGKQWIM